MEMGYHSGDHWRRYRRLKRDVALVAIDAMASGIIYSFVRTLH